MNIVKYRTAMAIILGGMFAHPATGTATSGVGPQALLPVQNAIDHRDTIPTLDTMRKAQGPATGLPLQSTRHLSFTTARGTWMSLDVSPDGRTIVFDLVGDLYTLPITGGKATRLTSGPAFDMQPRFSPDGKRIVFISDRSGGQNVWIMSLDGRDTVRVTRGEDFLYTSPAWTPDGKDIVATMTRESAGGDVGKLWLYDVRGGSGVQLVREPALQKTVGATFGNDPRYIWYAFSTRDWEYDAILPQYQLAVYDRETGTQTTMSSRYGSAFTPRFSPDGKWLAYGTRYETQTGLRLRDRSTGAEHWLRYPIQHDNQEGRAIRDVIPGYAFTPDSKNVIMSYDGQIWRVPLDGSAPVNVPFSADVQLDIGPKVHFSHRVAPDSTFIVRQIRNAVPSPDGKRLAFSALDRIYVMDYPNGTPHRVSTLDVNEQYPTWSPDGKFLAWTTWDDRVGGHIYKARVDAAARLPNSSPQRLTDIAALYSDLAWSPHGNRLVALRSAARDMHQATIHVTQLGEHFVWVSTDGGPVHVIAPSGGRSHPHFVTTDSTHIYAYNPREGLVSFRWDGTDVRSLLKVVGRASPWSATPRQPPANLIVMAPTGGKALADVRGDIYVIPVPVVGAEPATISVANPEHASFPVHKLTDVGGEFATWGSDGQTVQWSIGNAHDVYDLVSNKREEKRVRITAKRDIPRGTVVLRGARAITMNGNQIIEDADIVIHDNRIAAVGARGTVSVPSGAKIIDVSGKTIVPGFIDTHYHAQWLIPNVHSQQAWQYLPTLAYGVTTTRDPQTSTTDVLTYSDEVEAGAMIGPRIYSTGPGIFHTDMIYDIDRARNVLRRYADYYDTQTIKMYTSGNRRQRQLIIQAARELGLMPTIEGGVDYVLDVTCTLDGYPGDEHTLPIIPIFSDITKVYAYTGVLYTPTLIVSLGGPWGENYFYTFENPHDNPKMQHFTPQAYLDQKTRRRGGTEGIVRDAAGWMRKDEYIFPQQAEFVRDLLAAGGRAGIGSHGQIQGIGYDWEMWMVHSGGVSNHDVLRMATIHAAEGLGLDADIGSIEAGKLADLVILDGNPLEDIRNTNTVRYVMKNGRLYEGDTLDEVWPRQWKLPTFVWQDDAPTAAGPHAGALHQ